MKNISVVLDLILIKSVMYVDIIIIVMLKVFCYVIRGIVLKNYVNEKNGMFLLRNFLMSCIEFWYRVCMFVRLFGVGRC